MKVWEFEENKEYIMEENKYYKMRLKDGVWEYYHNRLEEWRYSNERINTLKDYNFIESTNNIIVDMDGVIVGYGEDMKVNYKMKDINFRDKKPVKEIIEKLRREFSMEDMVVVSAVPYSSQIREKNEWLNEHFNVKRRYFTKNEIDYKVNFIDSSFTKDYIVIDDNHSILSKLEEKGFRVMHPSYFLSTYRGKEEE